MRQAEIDQLTDGGQHYFYRDGQWTTPTGYCVSTSQGQALTLKFWELNGRSPLSEPQPAARRRRGGGKA